MDKLKNSYYEDLIIFIDGL